MTDEDQYAPMTRAFIAIEHATAEFAANHVSKIVEEQGVLSVTDLIDILQAEKEAARVKLAEYDARK